MSDDKVHVSSVSDDCSDTLPSIMSTKMTTSNVTERDKDLRLVWTGGGKRERDKRSAFSQYSYHRTANLPQTSCNRVHKSLVSHWMLHLVVFLCVICSPVLCQTENTCNGNYCAATSRNFFDPDNVNGVSVEVSSECGFIEATGIAETTQYRKSELLNDGTIYNCNADNTSEAHPKSGLYDKNIEVSPSENQIKNPVVDTYWQSDNAISYQGQLIPEEQFILLNTTEPFLLTKVKISFISPFSDNFDSDMRSLTMCIQSATETGDGSTVEYKNLRCYAKDCTDALLPNGREMYALRIQDTSPIEAACIEEYYAGDTATDAGIGDGLQEVGIFLLTKRKVKIMGSRVSSVNAATKTLTTT